MNNQIAKLHIRALPNTWSSRRGERFVTFLYKLVERMGYIKYARRDDNIVGIISGVGKLILTLVVEPSWQRKGIGKELISSLEGERFVYTNQSGVGFYEKMKFKKIGQIAKVIFLCRK